MHIQQAFDQHHHIFGVVFFLCGAALTKQFLKYFPSGIRDSDPGIRPFVNFAGVVFAGLVGFPLMICGAILLLVVR